MLPDLTRFDRIGLDTETTGLGYTDRPVGLSYYLPDGTGDYLAWGHAEGNNCTLDQVRAWAKAELPKVRKQWFNEPFDARMLAYVDIPVPGLHDDASVMAVLLNELEEDLSLEGVGFKHLGEKKQGDELYAWLAARFGGRPTRKQQGPRIAQAPGHIVAPYAKQDARLAGLLCDHLGPQVLRDFAPLYALEMNLIPILLKMHLVGVRIDKPAAEATRQILRDKYDEAKKRWVDEVGDVNVNSGVQLAALFMSRGLRVNATAKGNPTFAAEILERMDDPLAKTILTLRSMAHYAGTFIDSYLLDNLAEGDLIHGEFHALRNDRYGTVSGRFSSGGALNLQNIPARDEDLAPLIRGLFIPYLPGQRWLKADYSQIEYRFFAHYAGGQLLNQYLKNPDIDFHQMCAELVGIPRTPAKNINFGTLYGMGKKKMASMLNRSLEEASELLAEYHRRIPEARDLYDLCMRRAARRGYITTWGGRRRRFPTAAWAKAQGWKVNHREHGYIGTHAALNGLLQGSAADLIKHAMVRVAEIVDWENVHLHLTVHDELDLSIPQGQAGDVFAARLREVMEDGWPDLDVPIRADLEVGDDWGHTDDLARAA